ncbi:di-heme-cytochrome C peroxidase [Methylomicrobium sp. Wu6]|uniref:di-heme-cytochrome C peroxidase n=1 Tax=Methylomicrobium sp. Wu6 TaxID=3107928 RepID=UPI002DD6A388|nr:di-heme-cytochrome C peroxidase [Methylomicrobium sp. Wu6]MEC4746960.1 di-heme-cytochrome C peroxidase [Methylomicrobium sp. Wu6]
MTMRHRLFSSKHISIILTTAVCQLLGLPPANAAPGPIYAEQGKQWTNTERLQYYSQDQGSRVMPLQWFLALKQANGKPFLEDGLSRYGYLPNPDAKTKGLPVGFTVNGNAVGITCSACHTRQIEVDGKAYRIDGGPAIADFQTFAADLDNAVGHTLNDPPSFDAFAVAVLGGAPSADQKTRLRKEVETWYLPYHTIMSIALPKDKPWGPARLDAVAMILNRVTGLDIGAMPDHIIKSNIHLADTPVRYPFVWNAPIQDKTQWPGFADNGNDLLGLSRNYGEVLGVFADFYPQKAPGKLLGYDYLEHNSANFNGLKAVEELVKKIGPPEWPWKQGKWAVNAKLAARGKQIYESPTKTENGGCVACHGIRAGVPRALNKTWATPLCYVGTDPKEFELFALTVDTGILAGAKIPFLEEPLKAKDENAVKVLSLVGMGTLLQYTKSPKTLDLELKAQTKLGLIERLAGEAKAAKDSKIREITDQLLSKQAELVTTDNTVLKGAFQGLKAKVTPPKAGPYECKDKFTDPAPAIAYESRVLQGIWATAPYLHNGSVPTLAALLEPAQNRPVEFKVGPAYDPEKIGLAVEQSKFDYVLKTTDCEGDNIKSGNSRCGHEFGTKLSKEEKAALLEYLKVL